MESKAVGKRPKESPLQNEAILPWTMNFAAGCGESSPVYYDNSEGKEPGVHPIFLSGCIEITGFWSALYSSGMSKEEIKRNTPAHTSFDATFHAPIAPGQRLTTHIRLAGMGRRDSGG